MESPVLVLFRRKLHEKHIKVLKYSENCVTFIIEIFL